MKHIVPFPFTVRHPHGMFQMERIDAGWLGLKRGKSVEKQFLKTTHSPVVGMDTFYYFSLPNRIDLLIACKGVETDGFRHFTKIDMAYVCPQATENRYGSFG